MESGNRQPLGISALCGRLLTAVPVSPLDVVVRNPSFQGFLEFHLYLSQQIGVRSSKTSQCGFSQQAFSGTTGITKDLVSFLRVCWSAKQLCQCVDTTYLPAQPDGSLFYELPKGGWRPVLGLSTFPTDWDIAHRVQHDLCMHGKSRKNQLLYS